ncbi:MAG: class I SAM-dependent methyltransferase [Thermodesulfobacteriota bacterium]
MGGKASIAGNLYDKYNSRNPVVRLMMKGFLDSLLRLVEPLDIKNVLEVGCGEGRLTHFIKASKPGVSIEGSDLSREIIEAALREYIGIKFSVQDVEALDYPDGSVDLVVACEVLEHLRRPEDALVEIKRVTREYALFSVPREPLWSILNMARGKYIKSKGNTPGHLQRWSRGDFIKLLSRHFRVLKCLTPLPWTMVLCRKETGV